MVMTRPPALLIWNFLMKNMLSTNSGLTRVLYIQVMRYQISLQFPCPLSTGKTTLNSKKNVHTSFRALQDSAKWIVHVASSMKNFEWD